MVVDERGRVSDVIVISPLGYGLDEAAEAAVASWRFAPGLKGGIPVKVSATVEMNFRPLGIRLDAKGERQRNDFNAALKIIQQAGADPGAVEAATRSMLDLCATKFEPAMYLVGMWKTSGEHVAKDTGEGLDLIRKAADKYYAPALYQVALRRMEGRDLPLDTNTGLREMRSAAAFGSEDAQFYLGRRYETGNGVSLDPESARRYYRLCSAQGVALCRYRLGLQLFSEPGRRERDYLEAVAQLQLAGEQGVPEAKELAASETRKLSEEQAKWVTTLKSQIVRK